MINPNLQAQLLRFDTVKLERVYEEQYLILNCCKAAIG
jgi:hypothetical protein